MFDANGFAVATSDYCTPHTIHKFGFSSLEDIPIDSIATKLDDILLTLEKENGKRMEIEDFNKNQPFVLLDWSTFTNGPQRKILRSILKVPGADSANFIFVNKDIIVADSLAQRYEFHFKF